MTREVHSRYSDSALQHIQGYHAGVVNQVKEAVARDAVVVVGMSQNPFVKRTRKALTAAGISFTYLEYGSYFSKWRERLAIKLWSGWPTYPHVFVHGQLIGGFQRTEAALSDGSFKAALDAGREVS